ncbi:MAG: hypothetical protein HQL24_00180 [Candidatus Omnitrophica bacterium]|nr:hypothetical protein [Candidatus Omnitrophota bacterium]
MKERLFKIEVCSPEGLCEDLRSLPEATEKEARQAQVSVYGSKVLVRQFELPTMAAGEVKGALKLEAAEILSLSPEEIDLEFHISHAGQDKTKGYFLAMPVKVLQQYLSCFEKTDVALVKLTARMLTAAGDFLAKEKQVAKDFCLLDFFNGNMLNLAVFIDGHSELLREIRYDSPEEAEKEVMNSLRYVCGRSSCKSLNKIYFTGDVSDKGELTSHLQKKIEDGSILKHSELLSSGRLTAEDFWKMNLLRAHRSIRQRLLWIESVALAVCLVMCVILGGKIVKGQATIKNLRASLGGFVDNAQTQGLEKKAEKFNL